jgi:transketolase
MVGWNLDTYKRRAEAFGWHAIEIDGHDVEAIDAAYASASPPRARRPSIVARTKKGKGVKAVEDLPGKHGKPLDDPDAAIEELGGERDLTSRSRSPRRRAAHVRASRRRAARVGARRGGRHAQGLRRGARRARASRGDVVALDGEVSNSTHSELFREAHEDRYFEMFIAEQQLVAAAVGCRSRLGALRLHRSRRSSRARTTSSAWGDLAANLRLSGSHAGVSIGEDGRRRWALEDMASFRPATGPPCCTRRREPGPPSSSGRWPSATGIVLLRTLRGKTEVRTAPDRTWRSAAAASRTRRRRGHGVACGITLD